MYISVFLVQSVDMHKEAISNLRNGEAFYQLQDETLITDLAEQLQFYRTDWPILV